MSNVERPWYLIPQLSGYNHPLCYPREDEVTVYLARIDAGFRFPYYDSLVEMCNYYSVPPHRFPQMPCSSGLVLGSSVLTGVGCIHSPFSVSSQTLVRFLFGKHIFLRSRIGMLDTLAWTIGTGIRGIRWWVDLNPRIPTGRANMFSFKEVSLGLWGCLARALFQRFWRFRRGPGNP